MILPVFIFSRPHEPAMPGPDAGPVQSPDTIVQAAPVPGAAGSSRYRWGSARGRHPIPSGLHYFRFIASQKDDVYEVRFKK